MKRISFILATMLAFAVSCGHSGVKCGNRTNDGKVPVIVITDLYFPGQDIGDNFDLVTPFSLPQVDLKAIILDVTDDKRHLLGVVTALELMTSNPNKKILDIMETNVISVNTGEDKEDVANVIQKYDFLAVPVVDKDSVTFPLLEASEMPNW